MYPSNLSASYCQLKPPFSVMLQNQSMHWHQIKVKSLKELKKKERKNKNTIRIILHSIKIINLRVLLLANSMELFWKNGHIAEFVQKANVLTVHLLGKGPWSYRSGGADPRVQHHWKVPEDCIDGTLIGITYHHLIFWLYALSYQYRCWINFK